MRLIKLTEVKRTPQRDADGYIIDIRYDYRGRYFNVDKIENFSRLDDPLENTTYLYMSTSSSAFEVAETPEEIIQLIEQAKEI
ncbi:hypothetical protein [Enterococcus cecorum]|uniref:hypothetical protein n=1 Tax=Enterococcus cecorum TaxID=44008 RepID=UPI001FAC982D|nr:hypothetical protein [Enterococcus cecorum]MCJ0597399.1 hypothetical protein [Enterococcus cecorum]